MRPRMHHRRKMLHNGTKLVISKLPTIERQAVRNQKKKFDGSGDTLNYDVRYTEPG